MRILHARATSPSLHDFVFEVLIATGPFRLLALRLIMLMALRRRFTLWEMSRSPQSAAALTIVFVFTRLSLNTPGLAGQHELQMILVAAFATSAGEDLTRQHSRRRKPRPDRNEGSPVPQDSKDWILKDQNW